MGSRLEQVSFFFLKNLYWRSSFSVPCTPKCVSLGTREERSLLDSGGSSRSSKTGSWTVSKGKVRVLMSYLRPLYKQLSENFKEKDEFRSWMYWCLVTGWTGSRTWNSNMSRRRSRKNFSSHMSGPWLPKYFLMIFQSLFRQNARILAIDMHHFSGCIGVGIAWDYFLHEEALW